MPAAASLLVVGDMCAHVGTWRQGEGDAVWIVWYGINYINKLNSYLTLDVCSKSKGKTLVLHVGPINFIIKEITVKNDESETKIFLAVQMELFPRLAPSAAGDGRKLSALAELATSGKSLSVRV